MKFDRGRAMSRLTLVAALALAAALLFLAFRGVDWAALFARLAHGQLDLLALAALTFSGSYFLRGLRWRLLLSAEQKISPIIVFLATVVGYLGNNFLPARAGEVIRSALLGRRTGVSTSFVLATALVERSLDVVALVLISSIALATLSNVPDWLVRATQLLALAAFVLMLLFVVLPRIEAPLQRALKRVVRSSALQATVAGLLNKFLLGMRAFQHPVRGLGFALLTPVIWLADSVAFLLVGQAFGLHLALAQALVLIAALGLASAAPSTPGYVGIYQFVAVTVLAPFGFGRDDALAFILAAQAVIYLVVLVWGAIGLWVLGVRGRPTARPAEAPALESAKV
jgi:hypothetical protein